MADITPVNDLSAFIPEIYSKKLARVMKKFTHFIERNCNREWEGEIRAFGDVVRIALPDPANVLVSITQNTKDVCPIPGGVSPTEKTLEINNIATFSLKFSDVDQVQSQFNLLDGYAAIAMHKLGDQKDKQVMLGLIKAPNVPLIGTPQAPRYVTNDDIYDAVVDARVQLMETGALNGDGFYSFKGNQEETEYLSPVLTVTPKTYGLMLKSTQLTHPTAAADNLIKSAEQPMMGGFEIDINTVLGTINGDDIPDYDPATMQIAIGATKMAVTYANQFTKVEKLRDPDCFADIVRGLELYGFLVVHPEAAVILYLTTKAPATPGA